MRQAVVGLCLLGLLTLGTFASAGTLIGTTVNGVLNFNSFPTNYFDPANGFVPPGFQNDAGPTVVIDGTPTFGFEDGANFDQANFSANTLAISDQNLGGGAAPWTMIFTDSAFTSVSKVSDTFSGGGLTYSLAGDVLTINWVGDNTTGWTYNALFDVGTGTSTPEPSSLLLMGSGILGLAGVARRKLMR
jgi:hypothetical protein